jgi:hypothetical protein
VSETECRWIRLSNISSSQYSATHVMIPCTAAGDNEPDGPVTLLTRVETMLPLAGGAKL